METLLWALGILVTIQTVVTGFIASQLWAHVIKCGHVIGQLASVSKDVERMKEDIGTTDRGLRGTVHKTANRCSEHEMRIALLERGGNGP